MKFAKATETCSCILVYDEAYCISVNLSVYYISVNMSYTNGIIAAID